MTIGKWVRLFLIRNSEFVIIFVIPHSELQSPLWLKKKVLFDKVKIILKRKAQRTISL